MREIFNIFQYLQMKGISMEIQKEYLDEFSEAGEKLAKFMIENPEKKLKDIKIEFPDLKEYLKKYSKKYYQNI